MSIRFGFVLLLLLFLVLGSIFAVYLYHRNQEARGAAIPIEQTAEWQLCRRWITLKNASDPEADKLLEPSEKTPTETVTEEQADHLDASFCLHHPDIRIASLRALPDQRFLLVAKGSVSAPELLVRSGNKVDSVSRVLYHPDVIVEVRNGKIHAIRPQMHTEP